MLTRFQKRELVRLFDATTESYFKAIKALDTRETQGPRVVLLYVIWEHLAWLWAGGSKKKSRASGPAFIDFTSRFLVTQPSFKTMLDRGRITVQSLWAERNKQLHTGRMMLDIHDQADPDPRGFTYCNYNSGYAPLLERFAKLHKSSRHRIAVLYADVIIASLQIAANRAREELPKDPVQGPIAYERLRLKGGERLYNIVRRAAAEKFEIMRQIAFHGDKLDVFRMHHGGFRFVAGKRAVELTPPELEEFFVWAREMDAAADVEGKK